MEQEKNKLYTMHSKLTYIYRGHRCIVITYFNI